MQPFGEGLPDIGTGIVRHRGEQLAQFGTLPKPIEQHANRPSAHEYILALSGPFETMRKHGAERSLRRRRQQRQCFALDPDMLAMAHSGAVDILPRRFSGRLLLLVWRQRTQGSGQATKSRNRDSGITVVGQQRFDAGLHIHVQPELAKAEGRTLGFQLQRCNRAEPVKTEGNAPLAFGMPPQEAVCHGIGAEPTREGLAIQFDVCLAGAHPAAVLEDQILELFRSLCAGRTPNEIRVPYPHRLQALQLIRDHPCQEAHQPAGQLAVKASLTSRSRRGGRLLLAIALQQFIRQRFLDRRQAWMDAEHQQIAYAVSVHC